MTGEAEKAMADLKEKEAVMTAKEVADFLKVSVALVRKWSRTGKLRGHRLAGGGDWRYLKSDVISFLRGQGF